MKRSPEANDLRAASLETLLHLVGAGFGITLVPALAMHIPWMVEAGMVARLLLIPEALRTVRLVHRFAFPRSRALAALAQVILDELPSTVRPLRRMTEEAARGHRRRRAAR
jgi:LysR family hydrogen peroxide-inducible transcriptional activator